MRLVCGSYFRNLYKLLEEGALVPQNKRVTASVQMIHPRPAGRREDTLVDGCELSEEAPTIERLQ